MKYSEEDFKAIMLEQDMDICEILQLLKEQLSEDKECRQFLDERINKMDEFYNAYEKYRQIVGIIQE